MVLCMRCSVLLAAALIASITVAEEPQRRAEKRVWQIDDSERIARRYEPGEFALRRSRAIALGREVRETESIVLGSENPELFLPWELIGFAKLLYYPETVEQREKAGRIRERAALLGFDQKFLERLQPITQPLLDALSENRRLQRKLETMTEDDPASRKLGEEARRVNKLICPAHATAIAAARQEFGRETFDRFLYEAIAPEAVLTVIPTKDPEALLWYEQGCR